MPRLFGNNIDKNKLIEFVGDISQICGIEPFIYNDGMAKSVRGLEFRTGSGLRFIVLPDRGLDIFYAEFMSIPLNWRSGTGLVSPYFYSSKGWEWLRSFYGGLLVTCGLSNVGSPCVDRGAYLEEEEFGGHGRISNTPAKNVCYKSYWNEDDYILKVEGDIIEASGQGENLRLSRTIETKMGDARIIISDRVENRSFYSVPHMFLYHINIGYPLLDNKSELFMSYITAEPLDDTTKNYIDKINSFTLPDEKYPELVYIIDLAKDESGFCNIVFANRYINNQSGLGIYLRFLKEDFPYLNLWKRLNKGEYVIGFEPGNCTVEGRNKQKERGDLKCLKPQESVNYKMQIGVLKSQREIDEYLQNNNLLK